MAANKMDGSTMIALPRITGTVRLAMVMVAEGVPTSRSAHEEAHKLGIDTPLLDTVHAVLFEGLSPRDGLMRLLARDPKRESGPGS